MDGVEIARTAARFADEKKGLDIVIYDLRGLSDVSDFFVIVTVLSRLQSRAIVGAVEKGLRDLGTRKMGLEGNHDSQWVLLDYGDVVVHVFSADPRWFGTAAPRPRRPIRPKATSRSHTDSSRLTNTSLLEQTLTTWGGDHGQASEARHV
jgi:ribosome-associated protein